MNSNESSKELLRFIEKSPTCFHTIANVEESLIGEGFTRLREK